MPFGDRHRLVTIEPPTGYVMRAMGPGVVAGGGVLGIFESAEACFPALGFVFFSATHPDTDTALCRSDGSSEGTFLASLSSCPSVRGLFRSDGSAERTMLATAFEEPEKFAAGLSVAAESVVFAAGTAEHGRELWATLDTPETTGMLVDIERATDDSRAGPFVLAGGAAHFSISPGPDWSVPRLDEALNGRRRSCS